MASLSCEDGERVVNTCALTSSRKITNSATRNHAQVGTDHGSPVRINTIANT